MESNSESQLFHCFMHWLSLTTTQNFSLCFLLPTICRRVQNTIDCTTYSLIFFVYLKSVLQKKISVFKQHIFVLTKTHNWKSALHTHTHTHTHKHTHIYSLCSSHLHPVSQRWFAGCSKSLFESLQTSTLLLKQWLFILMTRHNGAVVEDAE